MFCCVNNVSARQLARYATHDPTPQSALTTIMAMQIGLLLPVLRPMMRRISARREHFDRHSVKKLRIMAASVDYRDKTSVMY